MHRRQKVSRKPFRTTDNGLRTTDNNSTMNELNFFSEGSPFLAHPLLTAERTRLEIDFVESVLDLAAGARVLDVGCGFGRHSVELAQRGYEVVGIDPSAAMITAAQKRAQETAVSPQFQQVRAEQFETDQPFDAAICLFTTLGQILAQGDNSGLVNRVTDALKPGGWFVVEVPQRETAVRLLKPEEQFGAGERYTAVTRHYDAAVQTVTEQFQLVAPDSTRKYTLRYRLYNQSELAALLQQAGFTVQAIYGSYEGVPLAAEHPIMIMVGRKG